MASQFFLKSSNLNSSNGSLHHIVPLNAIVAQTKNCPFLVITAIELKNVTTTSDFRQRIACHPQRALMILAKITISMNIPVV